MFVRKGCFAGLLTIPLPLPLFLPQTISTSTVGNDLIGEIPPEISQLRFLQYLALNDNCLYGEVPPEFGKMPNLLSLELHGNGLSGDLPEELYDASKLQLLNVAMQYQFSSVCRRSNGTLVNTLYQRGDPYTGMYNPGLSGHVLGPNVNKWSSMKGLHLFDNSFTGWIDEPIGDLKYLGECVVLCGMGIGGVAVFLVKPRLLIYMSSHFYSVPSRPKQHLVKLAPRRTYKAQEATRSLPKQERFPIRHPQVHRRHGRPRGLARQRERDERHHPRVVVYATEAQVSMASGYVELQRAGQRRVGLQRRRRRRVHGIDQHRDWKPEEAIVAVGE